MKVLYVVEGTQPMSIHESLPFSFVTTPWGTNPANPVLKVWENVNGPWVDCTATMVPSGSASAAGDVITLPLITAPTEGHTYLAICTFVSGGATFAVHIEIAAEK